MVLIALAFGLSAVAMAYCIGRVSGFHIDPAITVGMLMGRKTEKRDAALYIVAQFIGGITGAFLLWSIAGQTNTDIVASGLGTNGYGDLGTVGIPLTGALVAEILLTMFFVLAAFGVISTRAIAAQGGLVIGLALVLVHLMGIALT